ncbi:MAG: polysaccharide deacetylase family protein [Myxococcales bacterium]|nr:polysaccharide deacetylase family protein [Myxococcales bacterium]
MDRNALYLTYDDGPNGDTTLRLLDLLDRENAHATFFVSGESMTTASDAAIIRATAAHHHTIGNHGLRHLPNVCPEFCTMARRLWEECSVATTLIRPPFGSRCAANNVLRTHRSAVGLGWSLAFSDWLPVDLDEAKAQAEAQVAPGTIVLLHDGVAPGSRYADRSQVLPLTQLLVRVARDQGLSLESIPSDLHRYGNR